MDTVALSRETEQRTGLLFKVFCVWAFVSLCRPQDIFPSLAVLRPVLLTGIATLSLAVLQYHKLKEPTFFKERQVKLYTALVIIMVLGIPFSLYPRLSFLEIFTKQVNVIVFFFIFYKVITSVKRLYFLLFFICLGSGLYLVFSMTQGSMNYGRLSFGGMFDSNDLAYFSLVFLPLNLLFISKNYPLWARIICFFFFGITIFVILSTGSRGGLLSLIVVFVMLLCFKTRVLWRSMRIVVVALLVIFFSNTSLNFERYKTLLNLGQDYNMQAESGRKAVWEIGVRAMLANPLTGIGFRCFGNAVGLDREERGLKSAKWQAAHSSVILIGAETGVIGLFLYLLMSLNVFCIFNKVKHNSIQERLVKICEMGLVGFAGIFICGLFLSQSYSFYWAFYVTMSAVVNQLFLSEISEEA